MSEAVENAAQRHRRMVSIIVTLQFLNTEVDLHDERFEMLEMLKELLPTPPEIETYLQVS
ncbi:hypothetical protein MAR621_03138 [Maribacter dokdonensis]|uniref:hypothetical protein n=1 Tax=Maribacter dokdonensis TaxID=320912 RepID=UPI001B166CC6|nr:hypothetical protein [Maribacter dokdonensis]CAG2532944.1 hypothetical protein MAR621_03138 [Maribacter dokdonensis]